MSKLLDAAGKLIDKKVDKPRIAVCLVSHEMNPVGFTYDLANLMAFSAYAIPQEQADLGINLVSGTYVHAARQDMLEAMLANRVTHILWLDTDMRFPKDSLVRLIEHKKDVVGINYAKRTGLPTDFVAIKTLDWKNENNSKRLETNESSTGLEEVDSMGMGMVLMRTAAIIKALPPLTKDDWFWFERLYPTRRMVGEDVYFFRHLNRKGIKLWVDHDLSKQCRHIGQFEYEVSHAEIARRVEKEA